MGTIHQLRWDRPRKRSAPEISPRRGGRSIFFGVLFIAAAIGATVFWREAAPPRLALSVHVIDGDSLRTGSEEIRLVGIDAPELRQTCRDGQGREWSCGRAAKALLAEPVAQGNVACSPRGRDRYGEYLQAGCRLTVAGRKARVSLKSEGYREGLNAYSSFSVVK